MQTLLQAGLKLHMGPEYYTPLLYSCRKGRTIPFSVQEKNETGGPGKDGGGGAATKGKSPLWYFSRKRGIEVGGA